MNRVPTTPEESVEPTSEANPSTPIAEEPDPGAATGGRTSTAVAPAPPVFLKCEVPGCGGMVKYWERWSGALAWSRCDLPGHIQVPNMDTIREVRRQLRIGEHGPEDRD